MAEVVFVFAAGCSPASDGAEQPGTETAEQLIQKEQRGTPETRLAQGKQSNNNKVELGIAERKFNSTRACTLKFGIHLTQKPLKVCLLWWTQHIKRVHLLLFSSRWRV